MCIQVRSNIDEDLRALFPGGGRTHGSVLYLPLPRRAHYNNYTAHVQDDGFYVGVVPGMGRG